jgi:formylmethanofuran dehydrogenase subunit E
MQSLDLILRESANRHKHLCPRQVLGARMSLLAGEMLELELPRLDKRLLVIAETDGCTVDGIIAATGCHVGSRTLRILDFGKVAATFVDTHTEESIRIIPRREARARSGDYAPVARNKWETMLFGYQIMPVSELFSVQRVSLNTPLSKIVSQAGMNAICETCKEEIINGREVVNGGSILCWACAGDGYYHFSRELHLPTKAEDHSFSSLNIKSIMDKDIMSC